MLGEQGSKTKIFLFLAFAIITIVFFTSVVRIVTDLFRGIDTTNSEIKCTDSKYSLINVDYAGDKLRFELSNQGKVNISSLTLVTDTGATKVVSVVPTLIMGDSRFFTLENISIKSSFTYFIGGCEKNKVIKAI
ncbi:MAG: hypothetical protein HGA85_01325 [Nanoarchaeota archaeon]|nr:hypothetical protein [Nanoarchaeota archaeon]